MDRRNARACAMKLIYEWDMGGEGGAATLTGLLEIAPDEKETDFMNLLVDAVKEHAQEIDEEITSRLTDGWELDRVSKVDLAILRVAFAELKYLNNPKGVVINEAVELASQYSADKSGAFINGLLGAAVRSEA